MCMYLLYENPYMKDKAKMNLQKFPAVAIVIIPKVKF